MSLQSSLLVVEGARSGRWPARLPSLRTLVTRQRERALLGQQVQARS